MRTPSRARSTRPERRVWQLAALMAAIAVGVALPGLLDDPGAAAPGPAWLALVPLFALAEMVVIHLPTGRSSHAHVLREIPAIAGLTFLASQQYITAYVLGAGLTLVLYSRVRGLKLAFNLAMLALEAVLGSVAYQAVLSGGDPIGIRAWAAAAVAVLLTDLVSAAAVTAAISLTESRLDVEVLREAIRTGIPAALVNICVALLVITLVLAQPRALPLLGALVAMLVVGYRVHVRLARGYTRLELLYEFVGSTGHTADLEDSAASILAESASLLHATTAELVLLASADRPARSFTWAGDTLTVAPLDLGDSQAWWSAALTGEAVLLRHDPAAQASRTACAPRDGLAVALRSAEVVEGVLLVSGRTFEEETFGHEDLKVFETLAAHAMVALDKATMVDRLRRVADEREHEARHDPLTGLPNRRSFTQAVQEVMQRDEPAAVLLLDLDDFKDVNDTLGHSAGDQMLIVTGQRLTAISAGPGTVARLGGDEFAVLLPGVGPAAAHEHAQTLHAALSEPIPVNGLELTTSASIGVAEVADRSRSSEEVLAHADVAMYAAKSTGCGVRAYLPSDGDTTTRRVALAADLKVALREGGLELYYQPQACADGGRVTGFEALLRWNHPRFGFVPPPEIVGIAHRTGLMRDLTDTVLEQALQARAGWAALGSEVDVAVNVTPADIADLGLVDRIDAALLATGTPSHSLIVEITESDAMRDPERSLEVLRSLNARGVRLSVDDFGTGHSSLSYLDRLPVHEVKIDQSFVFRLEKDAADSTIVRATVALAHDLGLRVVAEGVENDLARARVRELGCEGYQGYGLARPMPRSEVLDWLGRHQAYLGSERRNPAAARAAGRLPGSRPPLKAVSPG